MIISVTWSDHLHSWSHKVVSQTNTRTPTKYGTSFKVTFHPESYTFSEGQSVPGKLFQWPSRCQEESLPFESAFVWPHSTPSTLAIAHQSTPGSYRSGMDSEGLQPTKVQPNLRLPSAQQECCKPRQSWGSSRVLVESTQPM